MKNYLVPSMILGLFFGCSSPSSQSEIPEPDQDQNQNQTAALEPEAHPGEALFKAYCFSCHNDFAPHDNRVAPPMLAIKQRYSMEYKAQVEFVNAIVKFVDNPSAENTLMKGAVDRFGVMPKLTYTADDLEKIADYIYLSEFKHPGDAAFGANANIDPTSMPPLERGAYYAGTTKSLLGMNLMKHISQSGTESALNFCNAKALHFTDSVATNFGVSIKRVSDKPRNPLNSANAEELKIIEVFKSNIAEGKAPKPVISEKDGVFQFYAAITTNPMCLQCHGSSNDIKPEVAKRIKALYPSDKATGYGDQEVRGIFSISWKG